MNRERLVAIDAQIPMNGEVGGVEQLLVAFVKALGRLDGPEQYLIVCPPDKREWLNEYLGPNQEAVAGPGSFLRSRVRGLLGDKGYACFWRWAHRIMFWARDRFKCSLVPPGSVTLSRGFYEGLGASVLQVCALKCVRTDVPVVFLPHDLQYEHLPECFSWEVVAKRRVVTAAACQGASAIVAGSQFTKDDVVRFCKVPAEKVWVIPSGAAISAYERSEPVRMFSVTQKYSLENEFILYPAQTWPHKNHRRLLEAILQLRNEGFRVNLVCTGTLAQPNGAYLQQYVAKHGLESQVRFLGFVPSRDLLGLYRECLFVVAPSLFEQASGPMYEAWFAAVPVCASRVCSIPDQAGDAALLFDPSSVKDIANAIKALRDSPRLREDLVIRGKNRLGNFSWERTAKAYRALYRRIARWPMTEEDRHLLGWDWMRYASPANEKQL